MDITRRDLLGGAAALAASSIVRAANDRIQVGVIGCGARSQELMQAMLKASGFEIVGIVDAYKGRIERTRERIGSGAKPYKRHSDLLAQKEIDAVVIATPDHWHKQMILDAVGAGKDVYSEKPLTYKTSEGVELIEAARTANRIIQVGSQGVSSTTQQKAKAFIQSGKLGKVTMIRAAYNRNSASGAWIYPIPPDASPATVDFDMFLGSAPKQPFSLERFFRWRCYSDYSGGIATDLFVHLCTTIHFLMDAKMPSRAIAMGELYRWKENRDVPDTLNAVLEYPEGFAVNLSSTFNNQGTSENGFQILGTEGTLVIGDGLTFYPERSREDNRWIVESWPKALEDAYYRDPKVKEAELGNNRKPETPQQLGRDANDPTIAHFGHWGDSIRTRKPYWEDVSVGHHAAACAHMVNLAAQQRRLVEWDFAKDDIKAG
jgi:predicted dehydrogenase